MRLRIEINDPTDPPMAESAGFAVAAERAGLDGVGMPDHQQLGRDVYLRLAQAAEATERVTLFPAVTNPITRHPAVVASMANALAESYPGRIRIMLGSGDQATHHISRPPATVTRMREAVVAIRSLLRGEAAEFGGGRVTGISHPCDEPPLVYVNASSPRMLEVAGEVADGVYAMVGLHPTIVEKAREHITAGELRGGRAAGSVPIAFGLPIYLGATDEEAIESARLHVFSYVSRTNRIFSRLMHEVMPELPPVLEPGDIPASLLKPMATALGVVGTTETCTARITELVASEGFDHYVCRVAYAGTTSEHALEVFASEVVPTVRRSVGDTGN